MSGPETIARRPLLVIVLLALTSALALLPASRLRIRAELTSLLPAGSPAADDYRVFLERFGGLEKVFLLVLPGPANGEDGQADEADLVHAAGLLEERLAQSPEVASVRAGLRESDETFFSRYMASRAPLLVGEDRLPEVARRLEPGAIRERVARLRAGLGTPGPQSLFVRSDPLGFSEELQVLDPSSALPLHLLSSTFLAPTGDAALLILTPTRSEIDPEGGRALAAELEAAFTHVRQEVGLNLEFHAVGGPLYAAQDEELLRRDLERTLTGSLLATSLILVAAFEGVMVPLVTLAPLVVALLWTAAWMGLIDTEITAISIGFGAVLVGLGIDYGIHGGARFRQAFLDRAALDPATARAALGDTWRHTSPGILTSALTTAAGFAVLGLAHFRPIEELGRLVAVGILSILLAVALLGSAGLVLAAHHLGRPGPFWRFLGQVVEVTTGFASRRPKAILLGAAVLSAGSLWGVRGLSVNADLTLLRPSNHPVHEAEALLVERFGVGLDTATVVVHGGDLPQALKAATETGRFLRETLGDEVDVSSPADYLALGEPSMGRRLRELAVLRFGEAADLLEEELVSQNLNPRAFAEGLDALRALGRGEDPGAPPPDVWPDWLAESLTTDEDGTWAALSLRLPEGFWPAGPPPELVAEIKRAAPGSAFASAIAIGAELKELAVRDLRTLSLAALAAILGVVLISFRGRLGAGLLAMSPVVLGALWTLGLFTASGHSLNLFTLAVLPILLGIGIDDGLHVIHGAERSRAARGRVRAAARQAGRALVLTTLTTAAGFGSLLLSRIPGLRSGGLLIAGGVLACLATTLLVLPALEAAREKAQATRGKAQARERAA